MEGRTIARPNQKGVKLKTLNTVLLQWRAGQLPGQTYRATPEYRARKQLQWRAGQLPGQTGRQIPGWIWEGMLQWRAGQLPGQT